MVDGQVVDPGPGDGLGVVAKPRDARPRHLERDDLALDGLDHPRGVDLEGGRDEVPVEEVVEVLVGRHPLHHRVALGVGQGLARVVMGDPGGQLLESQVGEGVGDARRLGRDPAR